MPGHVILSHGSDSGPGATKVSALAELAEAMGWVTTRPDYREDDKRGYAGSVAPRIARLHAHIQALKAPPVLVGSSMGAFVSGLVSLDVPVAGLFLLATPALIPGYEKAFDLRKQVPTLLMHGQQDEICPIEQIEAFAGKRSLPLLVLHDDHRLTASMESIGQQFRLFLDLVINHRQATAQ
ncbi:alpha/beta hydrolase [Dyella silvatica]|uniref:alpha/beta hydrolase n=1 Tax=Dyella silvatica TaxID=2992128 RepID=UPI00225770C9|nr:alpha/beta family hydrolase [Dyella silvatica]